MEVKYFLVTQLVEEIELDDEAIDFEDEDEETVLVDEDGEEYELVED